MSVSRGCSHVHKEMGAYLYAMLAFFTHLRGSGNRSSAQMVTVERDRWNGNGGLWFPVGFLLLKQNFVPHAYMPCSKTLRKYKSTEIPICNSAFLKLTVAGEHWPSRRLLFRWLCMMFSLPWDLGSVPHHPCPWPPVLPAHQLWARRCRRLTSIQCSFPSPQWK